MAGIPMKEVSGRDPEAQKTLELEYGAYNSAVKKIGEVLKPVVREEIQARLEAGLIKEKSSIVYYISRFLSGVRRTLEDGDENNSNYSDTPWVSDGQRVWIIA